MKQRLTYLFAVLAYWSGIDALFYWLNRRSKRILTFHNVLPDEMFNGQTSVLSDSESSFRKKIRELKQSGWRFSNDINDTQTITITFDDGYRNEAEIAGRILDEEGDIPAIIFAIDNLVDEQNPLNSPVIDLLMHWRVCAPNGHYVVSPEGLPAREFDLTDDNRQKIGVEVVRPLYALDAQTRGHRVLAAFDRAYPLVKILARFSSTYLRLRLTGITSELIKDRKEKGWLIGSHSKAHFVLSALSDSELCRDINDVRPEFKNVVFSYPYGETRSVDDRCIACARSSGYPGAVSNLPDSGGKASRYFMPRFAIPEDRYELHFYLSGLKTFMRTGKLLPVVKI